VLDDLRVAIGEHAEVRLGVADIDHEQHCVADYLGSPAFGCES
jgi:hypothetical protein